MSEPPFAKKLRGFDVRATAGVAWYTEREWARVKAVAADPERFEATFAEWLTMAEDSLERMLRAGMLGERVLINADELLAWCEAQGRPNDAAARAAFVSDLMRSRTETRLTRR
jgi:hypothetical protein